MFNHLQDIPARVGCKINNESEHVIKIQDHISLHQVKTLVLQKQ